MEVMKQLDQGEIAATARARLHGDMMPQRNDVQLSRPQAPRPMTPAMNPAFTYQGTWNAANFLNRPFLIDLLGVRLFLFAGW